VRVALVVPGGVDRSGEQRVIPVLLALLERLARRHDVQVFALRQEAEPARWPLCGATIHNIGGTGGWRTQLRAVRAIVQEHGRQPFDLVHSIWSGPCGVVAVASARWLGLPSAVHVAGGELVALPEIGYGAQLHWKARWIERWTLRHTQIVSAASDPMVSELARRGRRARRIALGVDLAQWPPRALHRRAAGERLRLIHVASLNRVKDAPTLLRAVALLAAEGLDFQLDIVGEDTLGGQIQALALECELLPQVHFHGFLTQRELQPLLARAHLLVMSSLHEAGPVVVLEAATMGIPCVGTAVGHLAEWHPEAALAVGVGDFRALSAAVRQLAHDETLRLRLGQAAQQRAVREDADHTAREFERLYAELSLAGHRAS